MSRPSNQMRGQLNQQNAPYVDQYKAYYAYNMDFASIASGSNLSASFQVQSDADFLVQAMSFLCYDLVTNAQITAPLSTVQITLSGSGTTFFDDQTYILNAFGTGQFPFILPEARLLPKNSNISGNIINVVSTNAQLYQLTFHGKKVYQLNQ